jgi:cell division protein FtsQ
MYALVVIILAVGVIITLSMTVMFNIQQIQVTGDAKMYSAEEIAAATGIAAGDNMVRVDLEAAEQRALDSLIYVEEISITRQFPDTLVIDVKKCEPTYNIVYGFGTLIVSRYGKILEDGMDPQDGLITIKGYTPFEPTAGKWIVSERERDDKILHAFMDVIDAGGLEAPIVSVDMTEVHNILVNFDHRIEFDMGNWDEIEYKINFAQHIISKQPADKEGYLTMIGTNQCSFRNKADVEAGKQAAEEATEGMTDESGNPVTGTSQNE